MQATRRPKSEVHTWCAAILFAAVFAAGFAPLARAQEPWKDSQVVQPADLAKRLANSKNHPLILQAGFLTLYKQSHIPGAEYCGPASNAAGLAKLRACVEKVPRTREIIIYCGCCPWKECPNVRPAFEELTKLGFKNVRVLDLPSTFGEDWVSKHYPVAGGR